MLKALPTESMGLQSACWLDDGQCLWMPWIQISLNIWGGLLLLYHSMLFNLAVFLSQCHWQPVVLDPFIRREKSLNMHFFTCSLNSLTISFHPPNFIGSLDCWFCSSASHSLPSSKIKIFTWKYCLFLLLGNIAYSCWKRWDYLFPSQNSMA